MNLNRIRLSGYLSNGSRGLILQTDETLWVVECEGPTEHLVGGKVTVEGNVVGLDRLRADWIGSAGDVRGRA